MKILIITHTYEQTYIHALNQQTYLFTYKIFYEENSKKIYEQIFEN